jgi:hypothetical protein
MNKETSTFILGMMFIIGLFISICVSMYFDHRREVEAIKAGLIQCKAAPYVVWQKECR